MPGRQSHGGAPSKKSKARVNSKKRSLNAFAIASHQNPDKIKIKQHRLGASEGGNRPGKRPRDRDEEHEEEESNAKKQRKGTEKGRFDELDLDEGSDSEGNHWRLGQVDSDDDSDLDSDEAFGESDEERFEGYKFSGSSNKKNHQKSSSRPKDVNLDDLDDQDSGSDFDEDDLGDDAVDLAAILDATEEDEDELRKHKEIDTDGSNSAEGEEDESEDGDDESSISSADDDETSDPAKLAALQSLIANLPQTRQSNRTLANQERNGGNEYNTPSDFGLVSKTKLTLEDLGLPSISDPHIKKSLKFLGSDEKGEGKRKGVPTRLEVPLAKRQQDRLDRTAAYDKSKETLSRWIDTVKHNRQADHLMFPLPDNDIASAHANNRLQPTNYSKPFNELEATIQSILEESGLATTNGKDDEDHIREFEELETKRMSVEEVKARRDQLRMARELLFREEAKAKRIKKIKSKSYRKVHRKQREKEERLNSAALAEGGFVPSEDELEAQDRRRAAERMGERHRRSKWSKTTKETGRAAWDDDARAGISEMARRDEDLRKRVEGRVVRKELEKDSDASFSDSEDEASDSDEAVQDRRILRQLDKAGKTDSVDESVPGAKLANMKFMRNAEAARKKENDATIEDIRRELAGEESSNEEEDGDVGRRKFGPGSSERQPKPNMPKGSEFEEQAGSEDDRNNEVEIRGVDNDPRGTTALTRTKKLNGPSRGLEVSPWKNHQPDAASEGGAWSKATSKSSLISEAEATRRRHKRNSAIDAEELDLSKAAVITQPKKAAKKSSPLNMPSDEDSGDDNAVQLPFAIRDQELIRRAFAGADVVGEFEAEKKQTVEDEDEKVMDNTLPGWGSWTGEGVSKRDKGRNKGRFLVKEEGIKEKNRKDAKLDRVIINEKRVKKNGKYLASNLPYPFETRQQYERSLRLPVGPEWSTKDTFQDGTKPRILIKQGIIAPMSKPLI